MKLFLSWGLPMLLSFLIIWFLTTQTIRSLDRIWRILLYFLAVTPILNWFLVACILVWYGCDALMPGKPEMPMLKETKVTRWLFESKAKKWDLEHEAEQRRKEKTQRKTTGGYSD